MANGDGYAGSGKHTFAEDDNDRTVSCEAKVTAFPDPVIYSASLEIFRELPLIVPSPSSSSVSPTNLNFLLPLPLE